MNRAPWLCFQVLVSRLGPLDTREFVLWHVDAILIHELVRSKVGRKMFRVHAFDGFIGKDAASHCLLVYLLDTIKSLGGVLVEAATEGLLGLLWIEIDGKKPVWFARGVLKELVKAIQIHIASDLLVYLLELVLVLELEQAEKCAVLTNRSWQPAYGAIGLYEHRDRQPKAVRDMSVLDTGVHKT